MTPRPQPWAGSWGCRLCCPEPPPSLLSLPSPFWRPQFRNPKASLRVRLCDLLSHLQRSGERHCQEFYRALYIHAQPLHCHLPSRRALRKSIPSPGAHAGLLTASQGVLCPQAGLGVSCPLALPWDIPWPQRSACGRTNLTRCPCPAVYLSFLSFILMLLFTLITEGTSFPCWCPHYMVRPTIITVPAHNYSSSQWTRGGAPFCPPATLVCPTLYSVPLDMDGWSSCVS